MLALLNAANEEIEALKKEIARLNLELLCTKGCFAGMTIEDLRRNDPTERLTEKQIKRIKEYLIPFTLKSDDGEYTTMISEDDLHKANDAINDFIKEKENDI